MNEFDQILDNELTKILENIDENRRKLLAEHLMDWLANIAVKNPETDRLPERLVYMSKQFEVLAQEATLASVDGNILVKVGTSALTTMFLLERGSTWFAPYPEIRDTIVAILLGA